MNATAAVLDGLPLAPSDREALQKALADRTLIVVQRGKYIVNAEGSQLLEIGDRYSEAALDRIEGAVRAALDGSRRELEVFQRLDDVLRNPQRHPSLEDFEGGAYYRNAALHEQVETHLARSRRCLVRGKPGHGKSMLAKAVGHEIARADPAHEVFYLNAKNNASLPAWMSDIRSRDRGNVTFIIDDCHRAVDAVNGLLDHWSAVRQARLLLVSRKIADRLSTSGETNYLEELEAESVSLDAVAIDFAALIAAVVAQHGGAWRDPGPLEEVIRRCEGDLFILDWLVRQWLLLPSGAPLADVDPRSIEGSLYDRYIPKFTPHPDAIVTIAALSQFEIDVDARFIGSSDVTDLVKANAFVEGSGAGSPMLRFFHSTPARYLVRAARGADADEFTKAEILRYIAAEPPNVLDVFHQLASNDEEALQAVVLASRETARAVSKIAAVGQALSDDVLVSLLRFLIAAHVFERRHSQRLPLLPQLRSTVQRWETFIADRSLGTIIRYLTFIHAVGAPLPETLLAPGTLRRLGERWSATVVLSDLLVLLRAAKRTGASPDALRELVAGVDLKELGQRTSSMGIGRLQRNANAIRELALGRREVWSGLWEGIDCRALGEQARGSGLNQVRTFLQMARRAGLVDPAALQAFIAGLDLPELGRTTNARAVRNVCAFILDARQGGVPDEDLRGFYKTLDWTELGRAMGEASDRGKSLLLDLALVSDARSTGIRQEMARRFVEGLQWDRLRALITERASPDVLSVVKQLLIHKCRYSRAELAAHGLDLEGCGTWLASFKTNPCPNVSGEGQTRLQNFHLRQALRIFQRCVVTRYYEELDLRNWNILIRNVRTADPRELEQTVLRRLLSLDHETISALIERADLLNLRVLLQHFHPARGIIPGGFPETIALDCDDLIAKLRGSTLDTISGVLVDLQIAGRSPEAAALGVAIQSDAGQLADLLPPAPLHTLDWLGWNLWAVVPEDARGAIYDQPAYLSAVMAHCARPLPDRDGPLLGIAGCMDLSGRPIPERLRQAVHPGEARQRCRAAANDKKPSFVRALAGLLALDLLQADAPERELYRQALEDTVAGFEVKTEHLLAATAVLAGRLNAAGPPPS